MPARGNEFYLRVEHENIKFISTSGYVILCLLYKHQLKGAIYYATITTGISSRVKITCYFTCDDMKFFARKLTWYFIGVYIMKSVITSEMKAEEKNDCLDGMLANG